MNDVFEKYRISLRSILDSFLVNPILFLLLKLKLTPNAVTFLGFLICCISAYFISSGSFLVGGLLVLFSGFMDIFDGALARKMELITDRGAFLDSTFDRLSEAIVLIGLIYFFSTSNETNLVLLTSLSLVFSILISYLRARIEGLGYNSKGGFFTRPERVLVVSLGLIFFSPEFTVTLLAIATTAGLFHRFLIFWRILK
ncbi:MAG: CDP-alcohol phosphatidyltransferase family protein [Chloroflexota bacterium]|nr:CDP-alcohol phosphatidyltransferase family protein [Chloroflexota bacterium]